VDVILANHMLYHVPNQPAAVAEFARVLRPGGYLLASTNSIHNLYQYHQLRVDALLALGELVGLLVRDSPIDPPDRNLR
jgi:2-polyprenyl-3-methyl-5-hydroxy-6-metoxy-1,4-benzoquinol methylase